eukprot:TRINITY_DN992_c0_g2_i1.p1 TRINITY_DN992_c0_g2~~TRINITY_DN992_c0_g2_i1.p1  ORF type:complete len:124 (-),score=38.05 TRINITY_DN992_c0_g2_i1:156-527(-)
MKFAAAFLLVVFAVAAATNSKAKILVTQLRGPEPRLPIGEGAYQSGKAVAQRTTDHRKDCEEAKWADCYKTKGDYTDVHAKVAAPKLQSTPARSFAASRERLAPLAVLSASIAAAAVAAQQLP